MPSLRYEPALLAQAANVIVALLLTFDVVNGWLGNALLVAVAAAVALATAFLTHPWTAAVFAPAVQACLAAVAAFGVHLSDGQTGAIMTAAAIGVGMLVRAQVTPRVAAGPPQRAA